MACCSWKTFGKNLVNLPMCLVRCFLDGGPAFSTYQKMIERREKYAPQSIIDQVEVFDMLTLRRQVCQYRNLFVDKELSNDVSRKELSHLISYRLDLWRLFNSSLPLLVFGGWGLPFILSWLSTDTFIPRLFNRTPEQLAAWRHAQDLNRYRFAPAVLHDWRFNFEYFLPVPAECTAAWEEINERNDVRRDPVKCAELHELWEATFPMIHIRTRQARLLMRIHSLPLYPLLARRPAGVRLGALYELIWSEDYMVITKQLHKLMTDEELQEYAWMRFLSPYDKHLTRAQVMERVEDYHKFLGPRFVAEAKAPNIFLTLAYCIGYYHDPGYLDADIKELEKNDFEHLADVTKDAFVRRLEFENGPFRDQVEAHTVAKLEEYNKRLGYTSS